MKEHLKTLIAFLKKGKKHNSTVLCENNNQFLIVQLNSILREILPIEECVDTTVLPALPNIYVA